MSAINHGTEVPKGSRREVLMGYQYALYQHKKKLREERDMFLRSQDNNSIGMTIVMIQSTVGKGAETQNTTEGQWRRVERKGTREVLPHSQRRRKKILCKKH
jgi:hypothetical protein